MRPTHAFGRHFRSGVGFATRVSARPHDAQGEQERRDQQKRGARHHRDRHEPMDDEEPGRARHSRRARQHFETWLELQR